MFAILIVILIAQAIQSRKETLVYQQNIFLIENQHWLMFPHLYMENARTYRSICTIDPAFNFQEYRQLSVVSSIKFNNKNLAIDLVEKCGLSTFCYAKIDLKGVLTLYGVEAETIKILYQHFVGTEWNQLLMLSDFQSLMWNDNQMLRLQYTLYQTYFVYRVIFNQKSPKKCSKLSEKLVVCWCQNQNSSGNQTFLYFYQLQPYNLSQKVVTYKCQSNIQLVEPLLPQQNILLICELHVCKIVQLIDQNISILNISSESDKILQCYYDRANNQLVVGSTENFIIYRLSKSFDINHKIIYGLELQRQINYLVGLSCVKIHKLKATSRAILMQCSDYMGLSHNLIMLKDFHRNQFYPFNPINSDSQFKCKGQISKGYFYAVCIDQIITKNLNFYFVDISHSDEAVIMNLTCSGDEQNQKMIINIMSSEMGQVYIDNELKPQEYMKYDDTKFINLKKAFRASDIEYYQIKANCPYLNLAEKYQIVVIKYIFSLYNLQNCIQVVNGGEVSFYRIIQIKKTMFYIQKCDKNEIGYGCELFEIREEVTELKGIFIQQELILIYIKNSQLLIQRISTWQIFQTGIYTNEYQIKYPFLKIRLNGSFNSLIFNLKNYLMHHYFYFQIDLSKKYFYQMDAMLELDLSHLSLIIYDENFDILHNYTLQQLSINLNYKMNDSIPYLIYNQGYLFCINQSHMTKIYIGSSIIIEYTIVYNPEEQIIKQVQKIDTYIFVYYEIGYFQIYDMQEQAFSAKYVTIQQQVLHDIIVRDDSTILIPINHQTYLLELNRNPIIKIGPFQPNQTKFYQTYDLYVTPVLSNGSCPKANSLNQTIKLNIKFDSDQIKMLQKSLKQIHLPYFCDTCQINVNEQNFSGSIFEYDLDDDYQGMFQLQQHMKGGECFYINDTLSLNHFTTILHHSDFESEFGFLLKENYLFVVNLQGELQRVISLNIEQNIKCRRYIKIELQYIVLCMNHFIIFQIDQSSKPKIIPHLIILENLQYVRFQISKQKDFNNMSQKVQLLVSNNEQIYIFEYLHKEINFIEKIVPPAYLMDFRTAAYIAISIQQLSLCLSNIKMNNIKCYNFSLLLDKKYATSYRFRSVLIYYFEENKTELKVKMLLFSFDLSNTHFDLELTIKGYELFEIKICNVFAGFNNFNFNQVIAVKRNETTQLLQYFIVQYKDTVTDQPIIVYYQQNDQFAINQKISNILYAEYLTQRIDTQINTYQFLFFTHQIFIFSNALNSSPNKSKNCVSYKINKSVKITAIYDQPPLVKFLILRSSNTNSKDAIYLHLYFDIQSNALIGSLIGFPSLILLFIGLIYLTNQCKDEEGSSSNSLEEPLQPQNSQLDQSSLLYSKDQSISDKLSSYEVNQEQQMKLAE